jgi:hypothetical protein
MKALHQKCTAHLKNGKECGKWAIRGAVVCRVHGGAAPQVKLAAEARLKALEHPAIDRYEKLMDSDSEEIAYKTCKDILDRTGHKPAEKVEISGSLVDAISRGVKRVRESVNSADD